ncbi:MAG: sigma-70 family RNA polymerase sigma factor [Halanaerobiaceae bacterium]|nr:sigma-70 family RNA polymerase sigma factor [Halanaerobiaceae bacterium]
MTGSLEELSLIEKAVSGDRKALERLLERNYRIVKGYLLKTTCNHALTEDLTQETMCRAVENIKKYYPSGKFSTWLITIASNLYRDYLRKRKRETALYEIVFSLPDEDRETIIELQKIMFELPFEKRAVVVLKHFYDFSYREIADILNCPVGTVRSRLHYSLDYIKDRLKKGGWLFGQ